MQEYIRRDRNGNELKVGDKVRRLKDGVIIGSGEVKQPKFQEAWANKEDVIWIERETANREFEDNIGQFLWSFAKNVEKIYTKQEVNKPISHLHAELIKLWADDPSIKLQYKFKESVVWNDLNAEPNWNRTLEYRVKPKEKKFVDKYRYTCENQHGAVFVTADKYSDKEWESFIEEQNIPQYVRLDFSLTKVEVKED